MFLAYLDPGSGSILIYVIISTICTGVLSFWYKIKSLFGWKKKTDDPAQKKDPAAPQ